VSGVKNFWLCAALLSGQGWAAACDLCSIYSADSARTQRGFLFTVSESYIPYETVQFNGKEVSGSNPDFRDTSITHFVPGYNFSERLGVSLNVPMVYQNFKRRELRYSTTPPSPVLRVERGDELDLGDLSLIGRWAFVEKLEMEWQYAATLLAGVKFPTGNTDRIADEVEQTQIFESFLPPGTPHDPLGHAISGVHQHDLSPGSGSFDGIFGLTWRSRWQRWFFNAQFQYYLRTEGESTFQYGDELMVSGGPGAYVLTGQRCTLSLQLNAGYDTMARDELLGRTSDYSGMTAWYLGPQLALSVDRFSAVAGVDVPLHITSNGLQNVPDFRLHASFVWRF
jgi:hypothetical protein